MHYSKCLVEIKISCDFHYIWTYIHPILTMINYSKLFGQYFINSFWNFLISQMEGAKNFIANLPAKILWNPKMSCSV